MWNLDESGERARERTRSSQAPGGAEMMFAVVKCRLQWDAHGLLKVAGVALLANLESVYSATNNIPDGFSTS